MKKAFGEGEETDRNASPSDVASKVKTILTATGENLFAEKEGLQPNKLRYTFVDHRHSIEVAG